MCIRVREKNVCGYPFHYISKYMFCSALVGSICYVLHTATATAAVFVAVVSTILWHMLIFVI